MLKLGASLLVALALLPVSAIAQPAEVILFRHGDKDRKRGDFNLSPQGFRRAVNLGRLLPACFGPIEHIGSYMFKIGTQQNVRSFQTAMPLAVATGINILMFTWPKIKYNIALEILSIAMEVPPEGQTWLQVGILDHQWKFIWEFLRCDFFKFEFGLEVFELWIDRYQKLFLGYGFTWPDFVQFHELQPIDPIINGIF